MNLRKCDVGKAFVAPSGRIVSFLEERDGAFVFVYEDDPLDGLVLSSDGLKILDEPSIESPWVFRSKDSTESQQDTKH